MELRTVTVGDDKEQLLCDFEFLGITVPAGFIFDGASTPRFLYPIIPPYKGTKKAACIHDYLCKEGFDRYTADKLWYKGLRISLVKPIRFTPKYLLYDVIRRIDSEARCILGFLGVRLGAYLGIGVYNV